MDFGALPPEINSARMYSGSGSGPMLAAAAAWDGLAAELNATATSFASVLADLAADWLGPSSEAMAAAATPHIGWMATTAAQAEQTATQAKAAAAAYEAAFAMTVPPPVIAANRSLLMSLVATNILGQNTPAIAATEAHYAQMWAQDAAAMYGYAGESASASTLPPFNSPPQVADPSAAAFQATGASAGDSQAALSQLVSATPPALQGLASAGAASGPASGGSSVSSLSGLSMLALPARMAMMPAMMLVRMLMMGATGSASAKTAGAGVNAVAPAVGAGAGSGLLASAGLGQAAVAGGPVTASAGMGQAVSLGGLSVPQTWAAAAPAAGGLTTTAPSVAAPAAAGHPARLGLPPMMPLTGAAGRDGSAAATAPKLEVRPAVMVRSPVGG